MGQVADWLSLRWKVFEATEQETTAASGKATGGREMIGVNGFYRDLAASIA